MCEKNVTDPLQEMPPTLLQEMLNMQADLDQKVGNPSEDHGGLLRYLIQMGVQHMDKEGGLHGVHNLTIPPEMVSEILEDAEAGTNVENLERWVERLTLAIIGELMELLRHVRFKWWSDKAKFEPELCRKEFVDAWHFMLSLALVLGFNAEELSAEYADKNSINHERAEGDY